MKLVKHLLFTLPILVCGFAFAAQKCPRPVQPELAQGLTALTKSKRSDDAMTCIRVIYRSTTSTPLTDDVRYQLALQMSDAMDAIYDDSPPLAPDARDASDLWEAYLSEVTEPFDASRISFGLGKLIQQARYVDFEQRLPTILSSIGKVKSRLEAKQADLLFSTIKRCPNWSRLSDNLACTAACLELADSVLNTLNKEFGSLPWAGSQGLARMSVNSQALTREKAACSPGS